MNQLTSLPNLITFGRILSVPVIVALLMAGDPAARWVALVLYIAAAISDWLDGYLARRSGLTSPLGQMLDPIADKLLVAALIVTLAWLGDFSAWDMIPALVILMREIFVSGLREFLGPRNVVVKVSALAKWKTTIQMLAFALLLLQPLVAFPVFGEAVLWLAGILTAWTGFEYLRGAWPHLRGDSP